MKQELTPFAVILLIMLCAIVPILADEMPPRGIRLDGSIGTAGTVDLQGPDYEIRAEYGQQAGSNLFHSFGQFNLRSDESATFSGPDSVSNIVSRITGGEPSWIDGRLASAIPGADLWFLNASGIMFGPNATLDLSGSFHASTGNYLRLGNDGRFYSMPRQDDVLSSAAPAAFGFLPLSESGAQEKIGDISLEGSQDFHVSEGETLSLIGGNIDISKGTLRAPGGEIRMAGVASASEVISTASDLDTSSFSEMGNITLSDKSLADVSGNRGGNVFIRGGQFVASDSKIAAKTTGDKHGGVVDIRADAVSLTNGSVTDGSTEGTGKGTDIRIQATESVTLSGANEQGWKSTISVNSGKADTLPKDDLGNTGDIRITAKDILLKDGAAIQCESYGNGGQGDMHLRADESVTFSGNNSNGLGSAILARTYGTGNGGAVSVTGKNISFTHGAYILLNAWGQGHGGDLTLSASESVSFSGEDLTGYPSLIEVAAADQGDGAGDAGSLSIQANDISFTDGASLFSSTDGQGKGGDITLNASESVLFSGEGQVGSGLISLESRGQADDAGDGGSLSIIAKNISFTGGTFINSDASGKGKGGQVILEASQEVLFAGEDSNKDNSGITMSATDQGEGAGAGGDLMIRADTITFRDGALIEAAAFGKGDAGTVTLDAQSDIRFSGRSSDDEQSGLWASVKAGSAGGKGGDVLLTSGRIHLDDAVLSTETAGPGHGGNIVLDASALEMDRGAEIRSSGTALSDGGDAGTISIRAGNAHLKADSLITTSSKGQGQAGAITLNVGDLTLETGARVVSESKVGNSYSVSDISQRDALFVLQGDVAEETDTYDGKPRNYVWTGDQWASFRSQHTIEDETELNALAEQYALASGDTALMADAGGDDPVTFIYDSDNGAWLRSDHQYDVPDYPGKIVTDTGFAAAGADLESNWLGLPSGTVLEPGDRLNITSADRGIVESYYVYGQIFSSDYHIYLFRRHSLSSVGNLAELNALTDTHALVPGDVAYVGDGGDGGEARFFYHQGSWIEFGSVHTIGQKDQLVIAKPGDVAGTEGEAFIFSGSEWLLMARTHSVANLSERDNLSPQTGDLVKVADVGNGQTGSFIFSDGNWISAYKSGDAGTITICAEGTISLKEDAGIATSAAGEGWAGNISLSALRIDLSSGASVVSASLSETNGGKAGSVTVDASDSLRLSGGSALATDAKSAGGGRIAIDAGNTLALEHSKISTSVTEESSDGSGGDIRVGNNATRSCPEFVILNNSGIEANARGEGDGGAIFIHTDHYLPSSDSKVTATSARGNDGSVRIEAPDTDISSNLVVLPQDFPDATRWMGTPCAKRSGEDVSRLIIRGRDAAPTAFDDLQASPHVHRAKE